MHVVEPSELTLVSSTAIVSAYPEWSSGTSYVPEQMVLVSNYIQHIGYTALSTQTVKNPLTTSGFWSSLGTVSLWNANTTYAVGDRVYLATGTDGHTEYKCRISCKNITPPSTSYWTAVGDILEWDVATAYVTGARVFYAVPYPPKEYIALLSNVAKFPPDNPTEWFDTGVANPHRLIDTLLSTRTEDTTEFTTAVKAAGFVDTFALFDLYNVYQVEITINSSDIDVFHETYSVGGFDSISTWSDFFFSTPESNSSFQVSIPAYFPDPLITLTFSGGEGETIGVGHVVVGRRVYLGDTQYGVNIGIIDYSRKDRNDWGEAILLQRSFAKTLSGTLEIAKEDLDFVTRKLSSLRAIPCVYDANYDGGEVESLRVFGFYTEFSNVWQDYENVLCNFTIEGLV